MPCLSEIEELKEKGIEKRYGIKKKDGREMEENSRNKNGENRGEKNLLRHGGKWGVGLNELCVWKN